MRAGGGKAKGGGFEREVCRALSLNVSNGTREDLFWRSAMSGGRATVKERRGLRATAQAGDISAIDPTGHTFTDVWLVECKFYKDLNLLSFFGLPVSGSSSRSGKLYTFWSETVDKAVKNKRWPVLIVKQNNRPAIALVRSYDLGRAPAESLTAFGKGQRLVYVPEFDVEVFQFDFPKPLPAKVKPVLKARRK